MVHFSELTLGLEVIAGLGLGIAFVFLFASMFGSGSPIAHRKYVDVTILGLNDVYRAGEKIDFSVRAKGYNQICGVPAIAIAVRSFELVELFDVDACAPDQPVVRNHDAKHRTQQGTVAAQPCEDVSAGGLDQLPRHDQFDSGGSSPTSPSTDSLMRSACPTWRAYSSIMSMSSRRRLGVRPSPMAANA